MRRWTCLLLAVLAVLFCTACGGAAANGAKSVQIEKRLAEDGTVLYTLTDPETIEALRDSLSVEYEEKDIVPLPEDAAALYIYTISQTETLKLGQKAEDLKMVPILRYTIYKDADLLTEEILPGEMEGVPLMEDLLRCTFQVKAETAQFLREYAP